MNVLHFAHSYIPDFGGTTTRLINLLSNPANEHLLCVPVPGAGASDDGAILREERFENISVRRVTLQRTPSIGPFAAWNAGRLAAAVRADDAVDVVQGHNPPPFARAAYRVARARRLPCIYEAHRLSFDSFGANRETPLPRVADRFVRWVIRREERPFFERADAVIVQTTRHRERILKCFRLNAERIHVIPMGVDETRFNPAGIEMQAGELRAAHDWEDRTVFLYNGYLGASNGIGLLLEAARSLPAELQRRVRVAILGRGPLQPLVERAERSARGLIQFLGLVPYERMPAYYAAADVTVIPLAPIPLWECNNPTKLLEAMAMERTVLGSDVGGVTELLEDGVSGVTFRPGDASDLQSKMAELARPDFDGSTLGRIARQRILRDRTWQTARDELERVYERFR